MENEPEDLLILVHAPGLEDDSSRPLAIVHGLERALPNLRLAWRLSSEGQPIALPTRDAWFREHLADGGFPLLCNGEEDSPVVLWGAAVPAGLTPDGRTALSVHAQLPLNATVTDVAGRALENVAEAVGAWWGDLTPRHARVDIVQQRSRPVRGPHIPPRGLPVLQLSKDLHSPEVPHHLGWINYWSAATARLLRFPDSTRDSEWLSRARRTPGGGWLLQLTDAPLDLDDPAHLATLLRAYERFPEIGGRAPS